MSNPSKNEQNYPVDVSRVELSQGPLQLVPSVEHYVGRSLAAVLDTFRPARRMKRRQSCE